LRVVVVGGGRRRSALLELEESAADLTWVARRPIDWVPASSTSEAPRGGRGADEAARSGRALPSIVSGTGVPVSRRIAAGIDRNLLVAGPMFGRSNAGACAGPMAVRRGGSIIWPPGSDPLRHLTSAPAAREGRRRDVARRILDRPAVFFAGYGPQASTIGASRAAASSPPGHGHALTTPTPRNRSCARWPLNDDAGCAVSRGVKSAGEEVARRRRRGRAAG
jgi:hypothetical protein